MYTMLGQGGLRDLLSMIDLGKTTHHGKAKTTRSIYDNGRLYNQKEFHLSTMNFMLKQ
jgi:hypothetical protein